MGKFRNGIMGTVTGKVGNVVGSTWKGINTVRAYAKPSNPQTEKQQQHRMLFREAFQAIKPAYNAKTREIMRGYSKEMSQINSLMQFSLRQQKARGGQLVPFITIGKIAQDIQFVGLPTKANDWAYEIVSYSTPLLSATMQKLWVVIVNATTGEVGVQEGFAATSGTSTGVDERLEAYVDIKPGDVVYMFAYIHSDRIANPTFDNVSTSVCRRIVIS